MNQNFSFKQHFGLNSSNDENSSSLWDKESLQFQLKNRSFSSSSQNEMMKKGNLLENYNLGQEEIYQQKFIPDNINIAYNLQNFNQNKQSNQSQTYRVEDILDGDKENVFINSNIQKGNDCFQKNSQQKVANAQSSHSSSTNSSTSSNTNRIQNKQKTKYIAQMNNFIHYNDSEDQDNQNCLGYPIKKNHLIIEAQKQKEMQNVQESKQSQKCNSYSKKGNTYKQINQTNNNNKIEKRKQNQLSQNASQPTERVSQRILNQYQQNDYNSLQKISKYLNRSLTELNSSRADNSYVTNKNILHQSLNQYQIGDYLKQDCQNEYNTLKYSSAPLQANQENFYDSQKQLNESYGIHDKEILIKMREMIHQLQSRDASQRLEISKLRKHSQELKDQINQKNQKLVENEYKMNKDGDYISQLDTQLNNVQMKFSQLQKQLQDEQIKFSSILEERNQIIINLEEENMQLKTGLQQLIQNHQEQIQKIEMHQKLDNYENTNVDQQNDIDKQSGLSNNMNSDSNRSQKSYGQSMIHSDEETDLIKSYLSDGTSIKPKERTLLLQTQNINFLNTNGNTLETTCNYFPNEEDIIREQSEEEEQSERSQYATNQRSPQNLQMNKSSVKCKEKELSQRSSANNEQNLAKNVNVNLQSLIQMSKQNISQQSNASIQTSNTSNQQHSKINSHNSSHTNTLQNSLNTSISLKDQFNKKNSFLSNLNTSTQQQNSRLLSIQSPSSQLMPLDSSILYKQNQNYVDKIATAAGLTPSQIFCDSNKVITSTIQMNVSFSSPASSVSSVNANQFRNYPALINQSQVNQQKNQGILSENRNYQNQMNIQNKQENNFQISSKQDQTNISINNQKNQQHINFQDYFSQNQDKIVSNNMNPPNNNFDPNQLLRKQNIFVHNSQIQNKNNVFHTGDKENIMYQQNQNSIQIILEKQPNKMQQSQQMNQNNLTESDQHMTNNDQQTIKNYHSSSSNNKDGIDIDPYQFITEEMTNNISSDFRCNDFSNCDKSFQNEVSLSYKNTTDQDELSQELSKNSNGIYNVQGELTEEQTQEILKLLKQKLEREYQFDDDILDQIKHQ
ncbi:hypothetical protein ABPG72_011735 [Tetrahymena utriculariae]